MTVLVTGANGRTSRHVISALLSMPKCPPLRLLVHSISSQEMLGSSFPSLLYSPHSIVIADYLKPSTLISAFEGITTVFHNGPAFHPAEATMGIAVIDAAKESGFNPHFVYCSVLHPMRMKLLNHKAKLLIEEYLVESKLNYTILQPTTYMQNVLLSSISETGLLPLGYSPSVTQGFLHLNDLAEVVRTVILSPENHFYARYELLGQNLPYSSVADIIGKELGKPVRCEVWPMKEFAAKTRATFSARGEYAQDASERMILYYDRWGLTGNSNVLRWLLGREPTSWNQYVRRELTN